jgi:hypothetical protein
MLAVIYMSGTSAVTCVVATAAGHAFKATTCALHRHCNTQSNCKVQPAGTHDLMGTSWDKGCMAASASGNNVAGLCNNQIRLVGVYGQLVGLRLPL